MYNRFNKIIVGIEGLGKKIVTKELRHKVTTIEEAKHLKKLSLEELLRSLITHEQTLHDDKEENESSKKKNNLALKLMLEYFEVSDDKNIALLTRKFNRFIRSKGGFKKMENKEAAEGNEVKKGYIKEARKDKIKCFGYNGYGHMQNECPNKKDDKGKKVLQVSMNDNESLSDDEDLSKYCFMAIDDLEGDLQCAFNELYNDSLLITKKNKELKSLVNSLKREKERLTQENDNLANQN